MAETEYLNREQDAADTTGAASVIARVLPETSGAVHRFLTAYLGQQRALLAATINDRPRPAP
ncbi:hypothetical protein ACFWR9_13910 [Streptomyces sp. NPDC058534]|uniref:hypothetical protein n=1 Tax=Streptomyces sp. NPDC058534 TaxID=3346541 RepID=UPI003646FCBC